MPGMAGNCYKWVDMAENGTQGGKWLKMVRNGWDGLKWLEWLEKTENCLKSMEIDGN